MNIGLVGQAIGMFAITNVDDIVLLAVFFGQAGSRRAAWRVITGQYLGFAAILAVSIIGALGAGLLPDAVIPYLGLVPLALGIRAAWQTWRRRTTADAGDEPEEDRPADSGPGVLAVTAITFANGGDNIGVYIPVFAVSGAAGMITFTVAFLVLVGVLCAAGWFFATRPVIARALARWGHLVLPAVLIAIGLVILAGALG